MIRAIIVDDEARARAELKRMLETSCPRIELVATASSVPDGLSCIADFQPDLVFLDIEMPDQNGFNLLEQCLSEQFSVIFTTAFDEYAIRAIRFSALDYLLKPVNIFELKRAVKRAHGLKQTPLQYEGLLENLNSKQETTMFFNSHNSIVRKEIQEILRFEAERSYTHVYFTDGKKILVSKSLKNYEYMLKQHGFIRCHRSHFVNTEHVSKVLKGGQFTLVLVDGSSIPVSSRRRKIVLSIFH